MVGDGDAADDGAGARTASAGVVVVPVVRVWADVSGKSHGVSA